MTESPDNGEFYRFKWNLAFSEGCLVGLDTPLPEVTRKCLFVCAWCWFVDFSGQFVAGPAAVILNMNDSLLLYTIFQLLKVSRSPEQTKQADK